MEQPTSLLIIPLAALAPALYSSHKHSYPSLLHRGVSAPSYSFSAQRKTILLIRGATHPASEPPVPPLWPPYNFLPPPPLLSSSFRPLAHLLDESLQRGVVSEEKVFVHEHLQGVLLADQPAQTLVLGKEGAGGFDEVVVRQFL